MSNMFLFACYDPAAELIAQINCEAELEDVLNHLLGFVRIAEMPEETRQRLSDGVAHLRHHMKVQTRLMKSEIVGRNC